MGRQLFTNCSASAVVCITIENNSCVHKMLNELLLSRISIAWPSEWTKYLLSDLFLSASLFELPTKPISSGYKGWNILSDPQVSVRATWIDTLTPGYTHRQLDEKDQLLNIPSGLSLSRVCFIFKSASLVFWTTSMKVPGFLNKHINQTLNNC